MVAVLKILQEDEKLSGILPRIGVAAVWRHQSVRGFHLPVYDHHSNHSIILDTHVADIETLGRCLTLGTNTQLTITQ